MLPRATQPVFVAVFVACLWVGQAWPARADLSPVTEPSGRDVSKITLQKSKSWIHFAASSRWTDVKGSFERWKLDPPDWRPFMAGTLTAPSPFSISIELDSVKTGIDLRDQHLRGKDEFFGSSRFPIARFESESITVTGSGKAQLVGTLHFRDRQLRLQFDVACEPENTGIACRGNIPLNRFALGMFHRSWLNPIAAAVEVDLRLFFGYPASATSR